MSDSQSVGPDRRTPVPRLALAGVAVSVLAALVMAGAAFGYRFGLWSFGFALLTLTRYAAYAALAGGLLSLVGLGRSLPGSVPGMVLSVIGVVVGGYSFHTVYQQWITVQRVPFIHDITTDTVDPPGFAAVVAVREAEGANPHDYAGDTVARQQQCGYPELGPLMTDADPETVYDRALATAAGMGWNVVSAEASQGRIEATDTSVWYGFKDDIIVRIAAGQGGAGARVDVRSLSRVGRSDIGVNAARIQAFLGALGERL